MNKYYYTFGSDPSFPYQNGWVEVIADSWAEAHDKFRTRFPGRAKTCLNCSFFYDEEEWKKTNMSKNKNYKCYEVIGEDSKEKDKTFDERVFFTFYWDYYLTAEKIAEDEGKEAAVKYTDAIAEYALYGKEPELPPSLKNHWKTTKTKIDSRRKRSLSGEDEEMSNKVLQYAKKNPGASQRKIAAACGCSNSKVYRVFKKYGRP